MDAKLKILKQLKDQAEREGKIDRVVRWENAIMSHIGSVR